MKKRQNSGQLHASLLLLGMVGMLARGGLVQAGEWQLASDTRLHWNMTLTAGSTFRTEAADPAVLGSVSSARPGIGAGAGRLGGNAGGNDLNFQRGKAVSSVIKSLLELELKHQQSGLFARAKLWHDFALKDKNRPYGNSPNGFQSNAPLSDHGFDPNARFSNAQWADVYGFTRLELDKNWQMDLRLGRQSLNWGQAQMVSGGINAINPLDFPARLRPGALPQEGLVPVGMLYAKLHGAQGTQGLEMDTFVRYEARHNVLLPCGTFYAVANFLATGCNYVSVLGGSGVSDPVALASGRYPRRQSDVTPSASGQYGMSLRYPLPQLGASIALFAARYHANTPGIRVINPDIAGGFGTLNTRLTDPHGLGYQLAYAPDLHMLGLSARSLVPGKLRWFAELAYRPNQPLNLNAADLIGAFVSRAPNSALNRALQTNALAPGAIFDGFQRFAVSQAILGGSVAFNQLGVAEKANLSAEFGFSHVAGLPDPGVLRFGRSDDYGSAMVNGIPCVDTTLAQKACALDGFVTPNAWGYRLQLDARYRAWSMQWTPSVLWSHDVHGYAYDGGFLQGRRTVRLGLRLDAGQDAGNDYFAQLHYHRISGGAYNSQIDRDTLTLAFGTRFK